MCQIILIYISSFCNFGAGSRLSAWRRPTRRLAQRYRRLPGGAREADRLAVEEPLEIRIDGEAVAVTMRTPGDDEELALGFCLTEGLRPLAARLPDDLAANTVEVVAPDADLALIRRSFYTSSSCGVCGKGALEAVAVDAPRVESELTVPFAVMTSLPDRLREAQATFALTGGLHATGLFAADGELLCLREDVGRHNAMDKVVGWALGGVCCRSRGRSSASAAGSLSSWCRRRRLPGVRCSPRSARPPRSPWSSRTTAASPSAASSAAGARTSTRP